MRFVLFLLLLLTMLITFASALPGHATPVFTQSTNASGAGGGALGLLEPGQIFETFYRIKPVGNQSPTTCRYYWRSDFPAECITPIAANSNPAPFDFGFGTDWDCGSIPGSGVLECIIIDTDRLDVFQNLAASSFADFDHEIRITWQASTTNTCTGPRAILGRGGEWRSWVDVPAGCSFVQVDEASSEFITFTPEPGRGIALLAGIGLLGWLRIRR